MSVKVPLNSDSLPETSENKHLDASVVLPAVITRMKPFATASLDFFLKAFLLVKLLLF